MKENTLVLYIPGGIACVVLSVEQDHSLIKDLETGEIVYVPENEYRLYSRI